MDLFEDIAALPQEVQVVCEKYSHILAEDDGNPYDICEAFLAELKPLGYAFEYGLDGEPADLHIVKT